jgi:hypothetical protein
VLGRVGYTFVNKREHDELSSEEVHIMFSSLVPSAPTVPSAPLVPSETTTPSAVSSTAGASDLHDVTVSMFDDHVVINVPQRLDLDATEVLMNAASAAVRSGVTVVIDFHASTSREDLIASGPPSAAGATTHPIAPGGVSILGAGRVRLATADSFWTIDVAHGRLFRAEKPIEPCFVAPDDWIAIRALWANCESVTALTSDGTYLSTRAVWAT